MNKVNDIVHDERTYIESIGKQDKETVRAALSDKGADTVLRVCIGGSGHEMPLRALGYYASAIAVQEHYFPESELQFVYPIHAAAEINKTSLSDLELHAYNLHDMAEYKFQRRFRPDSPERGNIKEFVDSELPSPDLQTAVAEVLKHEPELCGRFEASNKSRRNYSPYVAAHVLMHDTNPSLSPIYSYKNLTPANSSRVISIGAQSERPFYLARMACKRAGLLDENEQVETGQLFTRHVLAPYLSCREGEPGLDDEPITDHPVASVERDLIYVERTLAAEQERLMEISVPINIPGYCGIKSVVRREFL